VNVSPGAAFFCPPTLSAFFALRTARKDEKQRAVYDHGRKKPPENRKKTFAT
jgi:hypothetical protein